MIRYKLYYIRNYSLGKIKRLILSDMDNIEDYLEYDEVITGADWLSDVLRCKDEDIEVIG